MSTTWYSCEIACTVYLHSPKLIPLAIAPATYKTIKLNWEHEQDRTHRRAWQQRSPLRLNNLIWSKSQRKTLHLLNALSTFSVVVFHLSTSCSTSYLSTIKIVNILDLHSRSAFYPSHLETHRASPAVQRKSAYHVSWGNHRFSTSSSPTYRPRPVALLRPCSADGWYRPLAL